MKANRKFLRQDDEAVSPVIAVILMVAITVVLAATVYVWVSGFGSSSSSASKSLSLSSAAPISSNATNAGGAQWKNYTVTAATPGTKYGDVDFTLNGATMNCADNTASADTWRVWVGSTVQSCVGNDGPNRVITAGDLIQLYDDGAGAAPDRSAMSTTNATLAGKTLRILDSGANSVILTLNIG